jgi:ankyrin repeat protein
MELLMAKDLIGLSSKDKFGRTPLSWASLKGHLNIVQLFREKCHENVIAIRDEGGHHLHLTKKAACPFIQNSSQD